MNTLDALFQLLRAHLTLALARPAGSVHDGALEPRDLEAGKAEFDIVTPSPRDAPIVHGMIARDAFDGYIAVHYARDAARSAWLADYLRLRAALDTFVQEHAHDPALAGVVNFAYTDAQVFLNVIPNTQGARAVKTLSLDFTLVLDLEVP